MHLCMILSIIDQLMHSVMHLLINISINSDIFEIDKIMHKCIYTYSTANFMIFKWLRFETLKKPLNTFTIYKK